MYRYNSACTRVKSKLKSLESFTWEQFCQGSEHSSLVKDGHIDSNDFLFKRFAHRSQIGKEGPDGDNDGVRPHRSAANRIAQGR